MIRNDTNSAPAQMATSTNSNSKRRQLLKQLGALGAVSTLPVEFLRRSTAARAATSHGKSGFAPVVKNRAPLATSAFYLLPLGSIRPLGWLKAQLEIQSNGLHGHLDEIWVDTSADGGWLGGSGRGVGSDPLERLPYYLDGLVPLAYLLDEERLKRKVQRFVEWALAHQAPSGMFGPSAPSDEWWPRIAMLKALCQYQEATGDERVIPLMERYFRYQLKELTETPLPGISKFRWQDELLSIFWLYNRTGQPYLLELAQLLRRRGHDWIAQFSDFTYKDRVNLPIEGQGPLPSWIDNVWDETHGVNIAQAIKLGPLWSLVSGSDSDRAAAHRMITTLHEYHGLPNGMFSCDELLAGRSPSQGSETCAVVEYMFSLEQALAIVGDPSFGDSLEKLAFNALPGALTDDMWARQYFQESNQVECDVRHKPWTGVYTPEPSLFGLETNDGCCTANFGQGWPKFAASLFMLSGSQDTNQNDGLVAAAYAPCELRTLIRGTEIHVLEETEYPFKGSVRFSVDPASPVRFPLRLRIPGWATDAKILVNGRVTETPAPNSFANIERTWKPKDRVELILPMVQRVTRWFQNAVSIERGPLVFSLPIGEAWVKVRDRGMTADWQVFPTSQWNYALSLPTDLAATDIVAVEEKVGRSPFSSRHNPVRLTVKARKLSSWLAEDGVVDPPPQSPVVSDQPNETITLVPYAAAKLRITAFPQCKSKTA